MTTSGRTKAPVQRGLGPGDALGPRPGAAPAVGGRLYSAVDGAMGVVSRAAMAAAAIWIACLGLWITADALGRALGLFSFVGTVTIATESVVAISFLCMLYATRSDLHIRATLVVERAGRRVTESSLAISYIAATALFLFLTYASWGPFLHAWRTGEFSGEGGLHVTLWPFKLIVVACAAAMTVECALAAARSFGRRGDTSAPEEVR